MENVDRDSIFDLLMDVMDYPMKKSQKLSTVKSVSIDALNAVSRRINRVLDVW